MDAAGSAAVPRRWHGPFPSLRANGRPQLGGDILRVPTKPNRSGNLGICLRRSPQQLLSPKLLLKALCSPPPSFQFPQRTNGLQRHSVPDPSRRPLGVTGLSGLLYLGAQQRRRLSASQLLTFRSWIISPGLLRGSTGPSPLAKLLWGLSFIYSITTGAYPQPWGGLPWPRGLALAVSSRQVPPARQSGNRCRTRESWAQLWQQQLRGCLCLLSCRRV